MKFLQMLDALLDFHAANPQWPITLKQLANIRVQAFLDVEPYLKPVQLPPVDEVDA